MTVTQILATTSLGLLLAGCAATVPTELSKARAAYQQAAAGPAATVAPADLHKAHEALALAEEAFKEQPRGYAVRDLAYVAERKSQMAAAVADAALDERRTADANKQYQAAQDAIMADTRTQLGVVQSDLEATQNAAASTAQALAAAESAKDEAEKRARDAMDALKKLAAVKEEARGMVITLSGSVIFKTDEATLLPEAATRLNQVAEALLSTKERTLLVEGHTDSQGSDAYNLALSQRRAETVRDYLVERGYDPARVRAVGIGEARPVADNRTAEGRANNRRVEIIVQPESTASR